ncbi:YeiH family protein [Neokomagataea anthophila]|uniref:Sulfate exporter family transporter n=1 Tax=Neokomagataea anthophila TaxID=2826925 RepID=A0ABS5E3K0_9PROT|nr:putative sulfate exporter family transporter [Neokomagataea anthophila]MBR0558475.1 putative sulfate exporter family transporter [Neokomagataea anthophila]
MTPHHRATPYIPSAAQLLPGIALCLLVTGGAYSVAEAEHLFLGHPGIEAMNLAILIGATTRHLIKTPPHTESGILFCAKPMLEAAILLLGASISATALLHANPYLLISILALVVITIGANLSIGLAFKLPFTQAALIACGNAICGNSAIVAVAPLLKAKHSDIAACITFTALLGVLVVLLLPLCAPYFGMNELAYGTFAGLTVYAVPQVVAATHPIGQTALQTGMFVKLGRVLLLGPTCCVMALIQRRRTHSPEHVSLTRFLPWYIPGFVILMVCRSVGLIPEQALLPLQHSATFLTVLAMAALGLRINLHEVFQNNIKILSAAALSVLTLITSALLITHWLYGS